MNTELFYIFIYPHLNIFLYGAILCTLTTIFLLYTYSQLFRKFRKSKTSLIIYSAILFSTAFFFPISSNAMITFGCLFVAIVFLAFITGISWNHLNAFPPLGITLFIFGLLGTGIFIHFLIVSPIPLFSFRMSFLFKGIT